MAYKSLKGVYINKTDPEERILIERDYQKKDTVNFFYFMCKKMGGGTITKEQLTNDYIKES